MPNIANIAQVLLAIQTDAAEHPDSGDFMLGSVLGMLVGARTPKVAAAFLTSFTEACGPDEREALSAMTDQILKLADEE